MALVSTLIFSLSMAMPAQSADPRYEVYQRTLGSFSSSSTSLTDQHRAQVWEAVKSNPTAEKFICTGIRFISQPLSENIMVRKRAKAACDYAKQLNPNLSTWFQSKPTQARNFAGKVLLTIKTSSGSAEPDLVRGELDRTDLIQGFQIKPIYLLPSDAIDSELDLNGEIAASLIEGQNFLQEELGYTFEFDRMLNGLIDIGFVKSGLTKSQISTIVAKGGNPSRLLEGTPFEAPTLNRKIYSIFVELPSSRGFCGLGEMPGSVSITLMEGRCAGPAHGLNEFYTATWVHEAFHNLGVDHVAEACDLMGSSADFPGRECFSNQVLSIDSRGRYYRGSSNAGIDITSLKVWRGNNLLSDSENSSCSWTYKNNVAVRSLIVCTIGEVIIGPRDFCWSDIRSASLQEWKNERWNDIGSGTASKLPWRTEEMWTCDDKGYVAPSFAMKVSESAERSFRWIVNGQTLEPFTVVFQR